MFALFAGENFYPAGGWQDLVGVYHSVEDARQSLQAIEESSRQWWQIVDLDTALMVESFY